MFWNAHSRRRPVNYFSDTFKDIFTRMVAFDPQERPTIQEVAGHPWVKNLVCSHTEIKGEFEVRLQKLNGVMEIRRK